MARYVSLHNKLKKPIELKEKLEHTLPGRYNYTILIDPQTQTRIPADFFDARNRNSGRGATIHLFYDNHKLGIVFTPASFTSYAKVTFDLNQNLEEGGSSQAVVAVVTSKWTDFTRFIWFGMLGQNYDGGDEKIFATWELKIPEEG